jgi:quercetin dioxygenase-like cupin family protein
MKRNLFLATAAVLATLSGFAQAAEVKPAAAATEQAQPAKNWQKGLQRTDLQRETLDISHPEVIQARVDFDAGVASPRHSHPGAEVAYVISGTFEYQLQGRAPITLKAGDSLYIPPGVAHIAKNVGPEKASELATYIVQKGEPLLKIEE